MKKLITTDLGGQPLYYKDFEFIQEQIRELSTASFGDLETDIVNVLNGAEFTVSTDGYTVEITTEGWAWYNGEYYYIPTQSATGATPRILKWYVEETYDARGLKTFESATVGEKDVYNVKVLKIDFFSSVVDLPLFAATYRVGIRDASETEKGILKLATEAEVLTGIDAEKAVTSSTLRSLEANIQEILAGTANKYITSEIMRTAPWSRVGDDGGLTVYRTQINPASQIYYRFNIFGDFEIHMRNVNTIASIISSNVVDFGNVLTITETISLGMVTMIDSLDDKTFDEAFMLGNGNIYVNSFLLQEAGATLRSGLITIPKRFIV